MLKSKSEGLSKDWNVTKRQGASYTGGAISLFPDGRTAACLCSDKVALLSLESGLVTRFVPGDLKVRGKPYLQLYTLACTPRNVGIHDLPLTTNFGLPMLYAFAGHRAGAHCSFYCQS